MAQEVKDIIQARPRQTGNKGVARKLRATGWVPAVAYGPTSEPRPLAIEPRSFLAARKTFGTAHIYDVPVEGGAGFKTLIKDVHQDPVSRDLLHIDLYTVDMNRAIRV